MAARAVHVTISGQVQGVGFRAWTERQALSRGLSGWVCNRRGGSVEAVFAGEVEIVESMLAACRVGPSRARVNSVIVKDHADHPAGRFTVRPTY